MLDRLQLGAFDLRLRLNWNNPKLTTEKHHGTVIQYPNAFYSGNTGS